MYRKYIRKNVNINSLLYKLVIYAIILGIKFTVALGVNKLNLQNFNIKSFTS